jgi:serine/threonine protein kinase
MGEYVAEGAFGKVFKAYHKESGRLVAIKQIAKGHMDEKELEVQTNEIELLRVCDHPSIVRLYDYFEDPFNIYLVMEYLEGANLLKYVAKKERLLEP